MKHHVSLIEFTVGNYRSIKEPVTFSMVQSDKDSLNCSFPLNGGRLLKSAAIFGPNATGKSNVLRAMFFARRFVIDSVTNQDMIRNHEDLQPFMLDESYKKAATFFETVMEYDDKRYVHGFEICKDKGIVEREWLKAENPETGKLVTVFKRNQNHLTVSSYIKVKHQFSHKIFDLVREDSLFVTVAAQFKNSMATDIVDWWQQCLIFNTAFEGHNPRDLTKEMVRKNEGMRKRVLDFLRIADLNIDDIVPGSGSDNEIFMKHVMHNKKGEVVGEQLFPFGEESEGTQQFFGFSLPILLALDRGQIVIFDELTSYLHPHLMAFVVEMFNGNDTNPNNAQLILTSHDQYLQTLLNRDQVWYTSKNQYGATELRSLIEYKGVRNDRSNRARKYLRGDFGAIPYLGDPEEVMEG